MIGRSPLGLQDPAGTIDASIVERAATWLVKLQASAVAPDELDACRRWRDAHPDHERAWQRLIALGQGLRQAAGGLPAPLAHEVLRRAAETDSRRMVLRCLAILGAGGIGAALMAVQPQAWRPWIADYRSRTGERRELVLADGTRLLLDSGSSLDVQFHAGVRELRLHSGAVFIASGHEPMGRPLRIHTEHGSVTPLGTRFLVRLEGGHTEVGVLEGAVELRPRDASTALRLEAGRQSRFDERQVDEGVVLDTASSAWINGMLVVERMPLDHFVRQLGRYRPGLLRCDPAVAGLLVSGSFSLDDPEATLGLLEQVLPVRQRRAYGGYWTVIEPR